MCGCASDAKQDTSAAVGAKVGALTLRVEDMTCGHCAATITSAIEKAVPGAHVDADPASKLVSVRGVSDLAAFAALVSQAGYTPSPAQA